MKQLFQATEYLHSKNICHRDLKPDNLLVTQKERYLNDEMELKTLEPEYTDQVKIKVIDFNVAVEQTEEDPLIKGGTGLKEWSAPETRSKLHTDNKIDCWTLGCIMFLMCTGT